MILYPFIGLSHWIALPRQVLSAFNGKGSLPIHEFDKANVQKPYARIRPFLNSSGNVSFTSWRLAHAIKKADCARWSSSQILWLETAGLFLENAQLFDWEASNFCLNAGMSDFYADFSRSSLTGRIAQGMALLLLEEKGYAYVGRFETEWKSRAAKQNKPCPPGKKKEPDFIAENEQKEWVLAESKGSFVSPGKKPNIKNSLKTSLAQLDGWDKYITPQPTKSFAIGTFLRESRDCSKETSLIAFVDPEPEAPEDPVEFPSDAVRRANYASWLSLMRFDDAANRIRFGAGEPQRRSVPVIALVGRKYAVSVLSVLPKQPDLSSREFWDDLHDWPFGCARMIKQGLRVELVGLDLEVFEALGFVQGSSTSSALMQFKPQKWRDAEPIESDGCTFYGSIFSDGSLLGELQQNRMSWPILEWIEIVL